MLFETPPNDRCIVYTLDGSAWEEEPAERILVLLNGTIGPAEFTLPPGSWGIFADADRAAPEPIGQAADKVTVPPNSGLLLMR